MINKVSLALVTSLVAAPAMAATQTWNFNSSSAPLSSNTNGNTVNMTSGSVNLTTSGWSDTGGSSDDLIQNARLVYYSNTLGMINRDEDGSVPDHSVDSYGDDFDMILLEFDTAVTLTSFSIGWALENGNTNQADLSLLAYTGGSFSGLTNETWSSLVSGGGWSVESNFSNIPNYSTVNYASASNTYSNYWLIGAYNSAFGSEGWAGARDGFKLAGITSSSKDTPPPGGDVPEPGTLVMLASGLLALVSSRRKRAIS